MEFEPTIDKEKIMNYYAVKLTFLILHSQHLTYKKSALVIELEIHVKELLLRMLKYITIKCCEQAVVYASVCLLWMLIG